VELTVRDTVSGATITTETLEGSPPPACDQPVLFADLPSIQLELPGEIQPPEGEVPSPHLYGALPSASQVESWLVDTLRAEGMPAVTDADLKRAGVDVFFEPRYAEFLDADAVLAGLPEAWRNFFARPRYELDLRQISALVEECAYGSGVVASVRLKRIQLVNLAVIHDRQTDSIVGYRAFEGGLPEPCPEVVLDDLQNPNPRQVGTAPSAAALATWIQETMIELPDLLPLEATIT
jgi:hypothetical protein